MTDTAGTRVTVHPHPGGPRRRAGRPRPGPSGAGPARDAGAVPGGRSDAVVLAVRDAERAAHRYASALDLRCTAYAGPETGEYETVSYVLEGAGSRFVLTSPVRPVGGHARMLAAHLAAHGDGIVDLAIAVPDLHYAYDYAVDRGALPHAEPYEAHDRHGTVRLAVIGVPGGIRHTLVDRSGYAGPYLPGYAAVGSRWPAGAVRRR
ncbi:VOC family protein [Kitasatospora sp. NPDC057223]|uniref:VOC family protein n=1 Tax=Kitasatospora sp. NPDC057223 TaxID=3346055 RepID=UPI0036454520